jgi:peptidyl-prolyl cis-trans isomerase C
MFVKSRISLAGLAFLLTLSACGSNDAVPVAGTSKDTAAIVNGEPIGTRLVDMMLRQRKDIGREVSAETRKAYIDRLAMQLAIAQEAVKKGLDKSPEVLDQLELMRQSVLIEALIKDYVKNNPISDDTLKAEYDKVKVQMAGDEYKARHILVETQAEAKDIIARLNKEPKAFGALAQEKSKDSGSKAGGGDLGWFDPGSMVPEFGAAVAKLDKGKFTQEPVKTQFGYHVIQLEDSRPKAVPPLEEIKSELTQQLQQQKLRELLDELKAKAKIEIVQAPAAAPAAAQEAEPADSGKK